MLKTDPILDQVAAVSCGVFNDPPVLDLDYEEDSNAEADSNFVLTGPGTIVEIQATGEKRGFSRAEFDRLFQLAEGGCAELFALQRAALGRSRPAKARRAFRRAANRAIVLPIRPIGDGHAPVTTPLALLAALVAACQHRRQGSGRRARRPAAEAAPTPTCPPTPRRRRRPPPGPITLGAGDMTCTDSIGAAAAQKLVDRCIAVSPATHPPCNADNICAMIQDEIDRSCASTAQARPSRRNAPPDASRDAVRDRQRYRRFSG